jgi:hypothetical protein
VVYAPGVSQGTDSGMSESYATLEAPLDVSVATAESRLAHRDPGAIFSPRTTTRTNPLSTSYTLEEA